MKDTASDSSYKTLYIFRHGETDWNKVEKLQGHTDVPLNARGIAQAQELAEELRAHRPEVIVSSDLVRALDTARIIGAACAVPVETLTGLKELNIGDVQGMTRSEMRERYGHDLWNRMEANAPIDDDLGFPGGETKREATKRAMDALTGYLAETPYQKIAIATHGFLIKLLIVAMTHDINFPFDIPNGRLFIVHYYPSEGRFSQLKA